MFFRFIEYIFIKILEEVYILDFFIFVYEVFKMIFLVMKICSGFVGMVVWVKNNYMFFFINNFVFVSSY